MPLMEKQRRVGESERPGYAVFKRRPRIGLFVLVFLALLVLYGLGSYLFANIFEGTESESSGQADTPAVEQRPSESDRDEEVAEENEPEGVTAPKDPTLYLTVPRLGLYDHTVRNDASEEALGLGAIKLPSTGFPWQGGDTNTYIACHRLGFPGTQSHNQCLNLPSMQRGDELFLEDTNGTVYEYRISEFLTVGPWETWVTKPLAGRDVLSLQTCIEAPGDFFTLGPNWATRFIVHADRVG